MENIKLVLVDLDGTLLDDQKRVSAYTLDVLRRLKRRVFNLAFAQAGRLTRSNSC